MFKRFVFIVCVLLSLNVQAISDKEKTTLLKYISPALDGKQPDFIRQSPVPDLYVVVYGFNVFYVSKDGRYVFEQTSLLDLKDNRDLTEDLLSVERKKVLDTLEDKNMVVYEPKKTEHVITVYTDVDCPYCQKFHNERETLLESGVKLRYMLYPRSGADTDSYHTAVAVMCSQDKKAAMTEAKAVAAHNSKIYVSSKATGVEPKYLPQIEAPDCENPIKDHMETLHEMGLEVATPQIILSDGELLRGYVPAPKLVEILQAKQKESKN